MIEVEEITFSRGSIGGKEALFATTILDRQGLVTREYNLGIEIESHRIFGDYIGADGWVDLDDDEARELADKFGLTEQMIEEAEAVKERDKIRSEKNKSGTRISNPNEMIQKHIYHVLEESGLTIEEWIDQNSDMCALPENKPASKEEVHAHELLAEYQAVMVDICRSLGAEPRVDISDPTYYQEVIDNAVAGLREPSLKNAVVLKQTHDDALLFTGNNVEPFVVALGYDPERKDWSAGTYYSDLRQAVCDFDKQFGTLAYSYNLSLDDLYPLLEEKGFEPTHENARALMLNTNDFEGVSEYINESLTRLFDDEIDSCEEVLERPAGKTMPEKSFHVRSVEEIKAQQQSHKPQGINPKDDLAMGREAASQSPYDHNRNIGRSR